ncbi:MAG TPA: universal stress protein [Kofleriaceae bacterium]|nr:universal stress protein [Kofleriaceae bacterium]
MWALVVGTDFSPQAEVAIAHAAAVAERMGAPVTVVHVTVPVEPPPSASAVWARAMAQVNAIFDELSQEAAAHLSQTQARLADRGLVVDTRVLVEQPVAGLCRVTEALGAALLVVGTHGRTGMSRFLLGSVAERVVKLSPSSVLVARGDSPGDYRRILVPVDFSPASEAALALAVRVAARPATLELFHAWQVPRTIRTFFDARTADSATLRRDLSRALTETGEAWCARHRQEGIDLRFAHAVGSPGHLIQDRLESSRGYDLVVTGSHGHRGVRGLLLGSVAQTTVRHAPCSVLVVRPRPE